MTAMRSRTCGRRRDRDRYEYDVSVIIPAYNEESRIKKTLESVNSYFSDKPMTRQIFVVDDGSDDNTAGTVEDLKKEIPDLNVVAYRPNRGKGYAVKTGIEHSRGEYVLFTDADNSTPIEEFDKVYPCLKGNEVVIGSRFLPGSTVFIRQPLYRRAMGRGANLLIRLLLLEGVRDTQCGFKAFQHEAAQAIFRRIRVNRFGFDMEVLSIARLLNLSVREVPVNWYNSPESRVRPVKDALGTFGELASIKLNLWRGKYK